MENTVNQELEPETATCIDPHHARLQLTLLWCWENGDVPDVLRAQSRASIEETVQCWWEMIVEAACIRNNLNRTNWHRSLVDGKVESAVELYHRLQTVRDFIFVNDIKDVRALTTQEQVAIDYLDSAINYYRITLWTVMGFPGEPH